MDLRASGPVDPIHDSIESIELIGVDATHNPEIAKFREEAKYAPENLRSFGLADGPVRNLPLRQQTSKRAALASCRLRVVGGVSRERP
jgi:hypothetical protein